jgi:hypothetical protein
MVVVVEVAVMVLAEVLVLVVAEVVVVAGVEAAGVVGGEEGVVVVAGGVVRVYVSRGKSTNNIKRVLLSYIY